MQGTERASRGGAFNSDGSRGKSEKVSPGITRRRTGYLPGRADHGVHGR